MATPIRVSLHGRRSGISDAGRLILAGQPFGFTMVQTQGAANIANVMLQLVDFEDRALLQVYNTRLWLSDATTGAGLTATTASGTVVVGTPGVDMFDLVSKKFKAIQTDATGRYQLIITDTAKTLFKVCVEVGSVGTVQVVGTLTAALYG